MKTRDIDAFIFHPIEPCPRGGGRRFAATRAMRLGAAVPAFPKPSRRHGDGSAGCSAPATKRLQWAHGKTLASAADPCETACPPQPCRAPARELGFVGRVEYRRVYCQTGAIRPGSTADEDLLTVYAKAFERDADPDDFSLKAILAHERGHQLLARHPRIAKRVAAASISASSEEILASLLWAMQCAAEADRGALVAKATGEFIVWSFPAMVSQGAPSASMPFGSISRDTTDKKGLASWAEQRLATGSVSSSSCVH